MCVSTEHLPWHVQCQPIYQISSVIRLRTRVTIGGTPLFQLGASLHGQGHNTPAQPRFQACVTITRATMHRCMRVVMGVLGPTQNRCTRGVCPNRSRGPLLTIREHDIRILQLWLQTSMHMSAIARLTPQEPKTQLVDFVGSIAACALGLQQKDVMRVLLD